MLLVLAGIPLLVTVVIVVLVMAPSLAHGPRYRPGQDWTAESEWFGAPHQRGAGSSLGLRQIEAPPNAAATPTSPHGSARAGSEPDRDTGGASADW